MVEFQVYFDDQVKRESWVAWNDVANGYVAHTDTKKEALKKAKGAAQNYANSHDVVARIEVYQKNGVHQKNVRVEPV